MKMDYYSICLVCDIGFQCGLCNLLVQTIGSNFKDEIMFLKSMSLSVYLGVGGKGGERRSYYKYMDSLCMKLNDCF